MLAEYKNLVVPAVITVMLALVSASVFVYYPTTLNVSGVNPNVKFSLGSNAGGTDVDGGTITVTISGLNSTNASISIGPTNEKTYYKDLLKIDNYATFQYYGWIKVNTPISNVGVVSATMYIIDVSTNSIVATIDLTQIGLQPANPFVIPASPDGVTPSSLQIDIEIVIDSNTDATTVTDTANIEVVYSPQNIETPP